MPPLLTPGKGLKIYHYKKQMFYSNYKIQAKVTKTHCRICVHVFLLHKAADEMFLWLLLSEDFVSCRRFDYALLNADVTMSETQFLTFYLILIKHKLFNYLQNLF